jgi:glycosyltransferase involved in cell wall biosynthesis
MCTYNGEKYLAEQLESILRQTRPPDELVVSDDGSTDSTLQILEQFRARAPFPVIVSRNSATLGTHGNFLECVDRCHGDLIAFSDTDDVWLPTKLEMAYRLLAVDPEITLVVHPVMCTDAELRPTGYLSPVTRRFGVFSHDQLEVWYGIGGMAQMFRAAPLRRFLRRERVLSQWHPGPAPYDEWVGFLASIHGKTAVLRQYQVLHRRHGANCSLLPLDALKPGFIWKVARNANYRQRAAEIYEHLAAVSAARARLIQALSAEAEPAARPWMEPLPDFYRQLEKTYGLRANLYRNRSRVAGVKKWKSLVAAHAYRSRFRGGFGRRALAKDLLIALGWR